MVVGSQRTGSHFEQLKGALAVALSRVTGEKTERIYLQLQVPKNPDHGELAFAAFEYAKAVSLPPPVAAGKIKEQLELPNGFKDCSPVGPFLNFKLKRADYASEYLNRPFDAPAKNPGRVIVEFSSPNIAKPFHVGHLRATLVGNALDRIYRYLGYNVTSVNHLGDWGTQFGFVWAGCKLWGRPENPSVSDLVELYRKATSLKAAQEKSPESYEGQELVNDIARSYFRDLEDGTEYAMVFWRWCLSISMEYFQRTYKRLNVSFDHYTGESFYSDKLDAVRELLQQKGVLKESNGALGVDLGEKLGFARIATPDGRSLYLTRDIATAKYRHETFQFDRALYVVGAPQTLHFEQLIGVLRAIDAPYADKMEHVPFGSVLGMKTRGDGEFVELNEFLDEATSRALEAYHSAVSKRPMGINENEVSEVVGLAAIVIGTLNRQRSKDVQFSWDTAMAFSGESGPYLLYSIARLNSVIEKAKESGLVPLTSVCPEQFPEAEAFELTKGLDEFFPTLQRVEKDNEPSYLVAYAFDVAKLFSKAYLVLRVVGEEKALAEARLALFARTREVLKTSVSLLGIMPAERM